MLRKVLTLLPVLTLVTTVVAAPQQAGRGGQAPGAPQTLTVWAPVSVAPEAIDDAMIAKIRTEGMEHSKIMWIEHYLTDVYGPRPTGSPNHVAAADWAIKTMTSWGMANAHKEPFVWGGIGWLPGRATGFITSPVKANIKFEAVPWSPSTNGTVSGEVVSIVAPVNPTQAELTTYLAGLVSKVKGGIVMVGPPPDAPVNFNEPLKRTPDDQVKARYAPPNPNAAPDAGRGGRGGVGRGGNGAAPDVPAGGLTSQEVSAQINTMLRDNPPALRLVASGAGRIPGVIVAQNGAGQIYDLKSPQSPGAILRNDDYGRIFRIIQDGTPVTVEFNIQNQYFPDGNTSYVTVGEIPGTDKADEVVMLGGHLDSWASATGATDNAIGSAVMLEAARILEAVGAKPRRTIRVALWSGEEEGLLGSIDYVQRHFGMAEHPTPEHAKLDAYWNIDGGTGRVRGATIFGPPPAAAILAQFLKPFEEWGVYGASTTNSRATGGTDSTSFNQAGLPGIGASQDTIEYGSTTHHTNLDTYERIVPDDVMKNAVISASLVYHIANREKMMPRYSAEDMPALPVARGGGAGAGGGRGGLTAPVHVFATAKNKPLTVGAPGVLPPPPPTPAAGPRAVVAAQVPATATVASGPSHGKLLMKPDGSFTYTPDKDFAGTDSFSYTMTAGGATATATATVVIK